jgi:glutamate carboxypeptidase
MADFTALFAPVLPDYLRDLETLVNLDCGTHNKAGVDQVARVMRERFRALGAEVTDFPQTQYGDMLYGRWKGRGKARIVMIGHMDTVFSDGTAKQFSFHKRGSRYMGAGVGDMKSGLLSGLYAAHAVAQSGFDQFGEIGLFCNSEEEIGSPASRPLYTQFVRGADAALVLESARESGAIVSARKGVGQYSITVHGKAAHAGVEPEMGANAILALAQHTIAFQALNGFRPGLTVNVGVVRGGTKSNVISERAEAEIDVRILRAADAAPLEQAMREILAREVVPGTKAELGGGVANPPMEKTEATVRLAELAKHAAHEMGFEIEDVATGGASDGNYTCALGTPTLDGLGPIAGRGHNAVEEFLDANSIVPRTALLAKLLVAIAQSAPGA